MVRFSASAPVVGRLAAASPGIMRVSDLQGLHDGLEGLADFGGGGVAGAGILFKAGADDAFQLDGDAGNGFTEVGRIGELDGADGLEILSIGAGKGMAAAGQLIKDDAEGPDIGLNAGLAGDELLGGHVADGAAAGGVGSGHGGIFGERGLGRVEGGVFGLRRRARPKSRILTRRRRSA